jgi:hypothetical protein
MVADVSASAVGVLGSLAVGAPVGALVGAPVGAVVGDAVGTVVGAVVGDAVGAVVGALVGAVVGAVVGALVGAVVGEAVGAAVGAADGASVGGQPSWPHGAPLGHTTGSPLGEQPPASQNCVTQGGQAGQDALVSHALGSHSAVNSLQICHTAQSWEQTDSNVGLGVGRCVGAPVCATTPSNTSEWSSNSSIISDGMTRAHTVRWGAAEKQCSHALVKIPVMSSFCAVQGLMSRLACFSWLCARNDGRGATR